MAKHKQLIGNSRQTKTQRHAHRMNALTNVTLMDDSIQCTTDAHSQVSMTDARGPAVTYPGSDLIFAAQRTKPLPKAAAKKRAGAKQVKMLERLAGAGYELTPADATSYRAISARSNYLSSDRVDIAYAGKELCRDFSVPNQKSHEKLKRLGMYLAGHRRLVYFYPFQDTPAGLDVYVDTDFAGCSNSRRSTSGGVALYGGCNVKHWSKTQTTVALSSGEAELHGIAAGMAQGLGLQALARDLGFEFALTLHSDATAGIGIARRRGMGKIRHLECTDL